MPTCSAVTPDMTSVSEVIAEKVEMPHGWLRVESLENFLS